MFSTNMGFLEMYDPNALGMTGMLSDLVNVKGPYKYDSYRRKL